MEWLDQLSLDAAAEAAPSPGAGDKTEDDLDEWLNALDQPEAGSGKPAEELTEEEEGLAWLDSLGPIKDTGEKESIITSTDEDSEEPPDWLAPIKDDPQPESLPGIPQELTPSDESSVEWLDDLSKVTTGGLSADDQLERADEWLTELSELEDEIQAEEELGAVPESTDKVDKWIQSLEQSEGEREGEVSLEPTPEETLPPFETPIEEKLEIPSPEAQPEAEPEADTVASMIPEEQPTVEPDADTITSAISEEQPTVEPDADTIPSMIPEEKPAVEPDADTIASAIPEEQAVAKPETDIDPSLVPDWLQDVAEQKTDPDTIGEPPEWLPAIEEPVEGAQKITPTQAEEWQPESKVEAPPQPKTKPTRAAKPPPIEISESLEKAHQAIRDNNIEEATTIYSKLIKSGKAIDETIEEIEEALRKYPIDVSLWQVLGDAFMRSDRLQEALDAYSKAEDLLR
jgi:hypothetical protein